MINPKKNKLNKDNFDSKTTILIKYLQKRGHPESTIRLYKLSVLHFFQWLEQKKIHSQNLSKEVIDDFLHRHLPVCTCNKPNPKSLNTVRAALNHFYFCIEGKKNPGLVQNKNPLSIDIEISKYSSFLKDICGLSNSTCIYRIRNVRNFLYTVFKGKPFTIESIRKTDFFHYISTHARHCTTGTKNVISCSLRSFLKYLHFKGHVEADFVRIVPSVPNWKLSNIPTVFSAEQIKRFLRSFNRTTPVGRRDYAMALCMTDLGLRASEVAKIKLHDIDWQQSILHIKTTKSRRDRNLPIPNRLGKAIVRYIKHGRL
ncbi:MAG: tyrosine-type recombinase/integrase, partial [Deltaproteobacteria bacterium]|nr:tyrosine-type recombinase/integrase [Deltaproteobacteria bacterium]